MLVRRIAQRSKSTTTCSLGRSRCYASVPATPRRTQALLGVASALDEHILTALARPRSRLSVLISQYQERSARTLPSVLPYESRPSSARRVDFGAPAADSGVVVVAHAVRDLRTGAHELALCTGFAIAAPGESSADREADAMCPIVTCAHTLEEIRRSPLLNKSTGSENAAVASGSFVVVPARDSAYLPNVFSVTAIGAARPHADLLLLSARIPSPLAPRTLPVSPYPAPAGTPVHAHFLAPTIDHDQSGARLAAAARGAPSESAPFLPTIDRTWAPGTVHEYRDGAGRVAQTGTYDALHQMLFTPSPPRGLSGAPIVDTENGAVVGVVLGARPDLPLGARGGIGWGAPAETLFEMFSLPGINPKNG